MLRRTCRLIAISAGILVAASAQARLQSTIRFRALEPIPLAVGDDAGVQALTFADVNKDGNPDLIAVEPDDDRIAVLLSRGDGTFESASEYDLDGTPTAVAVADVTSPFASDAAGDVDGNPDIVVTDDTGCAYILLGRGDGTFDPPEQDLSDVLDSLELIGIAVGDFDRNGRPDLALLDAFDEVYFLCNNNGNFTPCATDVVETTGMGALAIAAGDFDGDTLLDIAVLNHDSHDLSPIFGAGNGAFGDVTSTVPAAAEGDQEPSHFAVGRLDADAIDDLLVADHVDLGDLALLGLYGRPRGFTRRSFPAPFDLSAVALVDLDNDARLDALMVVDQNADGIIVSRGDDEGGFNAPLLAPGFAVGTWRALSTADVNGDTKPDFAVLSSDGSAIRVGLNATPPFCAGDCNQNDVVSIDELVLSVAIVLGERTGTACEAADADGSHTVQINDLIVAVGRALNGCPT